MPHTARPKRFVLFGYLGGRNLGDDAMLAGLFAAAPPEARFVVLAREPAAVQCPADRDVEVRSTAIVGALAAILRADGVVRVGGTSFHDEYRGKARRRMAFNYVRLAALYLFARLAGKKVGAFGVGAGRAEARLTRACARLAYGSCHVIVARDAASAAAFRRRAGDRKVVEGVDLAFLGASPAAPPDPDGVLGVSVLDLAPFQDIGARGELSLWTDLISDTAQRAGTRRLSIFAFKDNDVESDLPLARKLAQILHGRFSEVRILTHADGLTAVQAAVRQCSVFLAARYHSAIFAALAARPMILVPYNEKLLHLAQDLGAPEGSVVDIVAWSEGAAATAQPAVLSLHDNAAFAQRLRITRQALGHFLS